ncbi:MAG: recombinase family protein [Clostridiales bacterium]|nr:recombinase family protein [Clostridiales bacterium]
MPYCIYLRKSRADAEAEARGEGETLARHEKALLETAKRLQLTVTQIYREIVSGETIAARPVMQQLLAEVEQGRWDGVLVMEVERLARGDTVDQGIMAQTFKFANTKIITPLKTYDPNNEFDEEYFEFGLYMSRREYKTINRRLQRGRLASVKEGKYAGNTPPYGYRRVKLTHDKGYTLEPEPEEAEIVRYIYDLYTVGEPQEDGSLRRLGISLIARKLNGMPAKPRKGGDWSIGTIRDILINPVYIGKVRWNWRPAQKHMQDGKIVTMRPRSASLTLVDGLHPPIISTETFNRAQEIMRSDRPVPVQHSNTVQNPLAGIIVCGMCGRKMVRRPYQRTEPYLICAAQSCTNVSAPLELVEKRLLASLSQWLWKYRLEHDTTAPQTHAQTDTLAAIAKSASDRLAALEAQADKLYDLLEQGVYTPEIFAARSRNLAERIDAAQKAQAQAQAELQKAAKAAQITASLIPKIESLLEGYNALPSAAAKNAALKEILDKVVYTRDPSTRRSPQTYDSFNLVLFPHLPE